MEDLFPLVSMAFGGVFTLLWRLPNLSTVLCLPILLCDATSHPWYGRRLHQLWRYRYELLGLSYHQEATHQGKHLVKNMSIQFLLFFWKGKISYLISCERKSYKCSAWTSILRQGIKTWRRATLWLLKTALWFHNSHQNHFALDSYINKCSITISKLRLDLVLALNFSSVLVQRTELSSDSEARNLLSRRPIDSMVAGMSKCYIWNGS